MNLAHPYGEGNHHRISWRKAWDVQVEELQATHRPTGFTVRFQPLPAGGYVMEIATPPIFGPDESLAIQQMFGLRELCKDGWEIFHLVAQKVAKPE